MNEIHKAVLLKHAPDLKDALVITESFLGDLYHKRIFEEEMLDMIRVCQLPSDKICKLIELLPKRDPEWFDSLMEILEKQYNWLAKKMKDSVVTENEKLTSLQLQTQPTVAEFQTPRVTSSTVHLDADIKSRASAFVQRQFGCHRKISMSDKKSIEKWIGEWLQSERKRLTEVFETASSNVFENPQIKEILWTIYRRMCLKQKKSLRKKQEPTQDEDQKNVVNTGNDTDDAPMETENLVDIEPEDMTFDLLQDEIGQMQDQMVAMEKQINKCLQYMGFRKTHPNEVSLEVHDLCGEFRLKERELAEEKKKMERMLVELYAYSTSTNRMQNIINNHEHQIRNLQDKVEDVRSENDALMEEIKVLERRNEIHLEKEHTLVELKKAKDGLQLMLDVVNKQNDELRKTVRETKGPVNKLYQSKRPGILNSNGNMNNKTVIPSSKTTSPRRNYPLKKKSNSFRS